MDYNAAPCIMVLDQASGNGANRIFPPSSTPESARGDKVIESLQRLAEDVAREVFDDVLHAAPLTDEDARWLRGEGVERLADEFACRALTQKGTIGAVHLDQNAMRETAAKMVRTAQETHGNREAILRVIAA